MKLVITFITLIVMQGSALAAKGPKVNNETCDIIPGRQLDAGSFGPYDYTDPQHQKYRPTVEDYHFTREVETLESGIGAPTPAGDIQYTLRKFPNHHRALYSMLRFQVMPNKWKYEPNKGLYTMECLFKRANYFRQGDPVIFMLHGMYYHKIKVLKKSEEKYLHSLALAESPETHYNLGLLYLDMKELKNATKHAKKAYELGYPLKGLRNKLTSLNIVIE